MAEAFIEEIYKYAEVITALKRSVRDVRRGMSLSANEELNGVYTELCAWCSQILEAGLDRGEELASSVIRMRELMDDKMLLSDHIEESVIPLLLKYLRYQAQIDMDTEDGYRILSSASGYLTIQIKTTGKYIHSTYDPMEEAEQYIRHIYDPRCTEYIFWGCGMGYYIYQLYRISDGSARIVVYESDRQLLTYAEHYGVLGWLPKDSLEIVTDSVQTLFLEHYMKKSAKAIYHFAQLDAMRESAEKTALLNGYVLHNTEANIKDILALNVYRNTEMHIPDVTELNEVLNDAIVVAAGPSLDSCMELLHKWKGKKSIIAVNTVFTKLCHSHISPDFLTAIDPMSSMMRFMEGTEDRQVPLVMDMGTYWKYAREYKGPKYMVYTSMLCSEGEEYIKNHGKKKWSSGGTVTFLAMEFAIQNHAKRVFFAGVDLGYPDNKSHAEGTAYAHMTEQEHTFWTEGVGGGRVRTDHTMNMFREMIEKRIEQVKNQVKFYNLSTCGSRIRGTIELDPRRLLSEKEDYIWKEREER